MMTEIEQDAIEQLQKLLNDFDNEDISETDLWVINNLIKKQQKEIEGLKQCLRVYANKKDNKKFISNEHGDYLIF